MYLGGHMNLIGIGTFSIALSLMPGAAIAASCDHTEEGVFVNHQLDGEFTSAQVRVAVAPKNTMTFELLIPCGTKLRPAILYASCEENIGWYEALVQDEGSSLCSLGSNPKISINGDELTIFTDIRTPGFSGRYEFSRQRQ